MITLLGGLLSLTLVPAGLSAAGTGTASCRNAILVVQDHELLRVDPEAGVSVPVARLPFQINAAGYADAEDLIYALADAHDGVHVVTVDTGGTVADRGPAPAAIRGSYVGTVAGSSWLLLSPDGTDLRTVRLPDLTVSPPQHLSEPISVGDWDAAADGHLYGVTDGPSPRLVGVDPATGAVTTVKQLAGMPATSAYGAAAMTPLGDLIVVHNGSGHIFRIPLGPDATVTTLDFTVPAYHGDAAGCPAAWDFGDAPGAGTSRADDGPRHLLTETGRLNLGELVTADDDGSPDDGTADDGDDGMTGPAGIDAEAAAWSVGVGLHNSTGRSALLAGWIDADQDGRFTAGERAVVTVPPDTTAATLSWSGLRIVANGGDRTELRLRLFGVAPADPQPTGAGIGGEVEDYPVTIRWPRPVPARTGQPKPHRTAAASPVAPPADPAPPAAAVARAFAPARTPLTLSVFIGMVVPAITLAARVRARSRR